MDQNTRAALLPKQQKFRFWRRLPEFLQNQLRCGYFAKSYLPETNEKLATKAESDNLGVVLISRRSRDVFYAQRIEID